MKNFEKYIDKIVRTLYLYSEEHINIYAWKLQEEHIEFDLDIHNTESIKQWLLEEYKEPIQLTHDEYVILKNLPSEYKFLWRDLNEELYISENEPIIDENNNYLGLGCFADLPYNYDFLFVNCEDEPYEIAKLIADYEKENEDA